MILTLVLVGLLLLALPGLVVAAPRWLPPDEWTIVSLLAVIAGSLALLIGLALAAVPALAVALGVPGVADPCRYALAPITTEPTVISWVAAAVAVLIAARGAAAFARSLRAAHRARVEPWLGEHRVRHGFELVTVPTRTMLAFGVPGRSPQVVVSTGLTERLEDDELEAVVAHEAAHLRFRHPLALAFLQGVDAALGMFPFVSRSAIRLRAAMEVWADTAAEDGVSARSESLQGAIIEFGEATSPSPTVAAENLDRVRRLRRPKRPQAACIRALVYAPVAVLIVTVGLTAVGWLTDAHHALALGDPCPH